MQLKYYFKIFFLLVSFLVFNDLNAENLDSLFTAFEKTKEIEVQKDISKKILSNINTLENKELQKTKLEKLLKLSENSQNIFSIFHTKHTLAELYLKNGNAEKQLTLLFEILNDVEKYKELEKHKALITNQIASEYYYQKDFQKALKYFLISYKEYQKVADIKRISDAELNLGVLYNRVEKYDTALFYLNKSLENYISIKDSAKIAFALNNIGTLYHRQFKDGEKSKKYYLSALHIYEKIGDKKNQGVSSLNLGVALFENKKYDEAEKYFEFSKKMAQETAFKPLEIQSIANLIEVYDSLQDYKNAYINFIKYNELSNENKEENYQKNIQELEIKYETEIKNKELKELSEKQKNLYFLIAILLLILVLAIVIVMFFIQNKRNNQKLEALKTQFYTNISHEFKTPLNLISAPLELIINNSNDLETKQNANIALRNTQQVLQLINQLLEVSKFKEGQIQIETYFGDIIEFTINIIKEFETYANKKNIEIKTECNTDAIFCTFDADKWSKVIRNLIDNAVKYSNENSEIFIQLKVIESELFFEIKDQGIGMSKSEIANIFNRFYRTEEIKNTNIPGLGVGMSIVKEYLDLMNGEIEIVSEKGKGSTFKIKIPLIINSQLTASKEVENNEETLKILVVEDNEDLRNFIIDIFHIQGINCIAAENGEIGFQLAQEHFPDLIISDLMMPICDGITMAKRILSNENTNHIPIVLLSVKSALESKLEGLKSGAIAYLPKPFNVKELLNLVESLIESRNKMRAKYTLSETNLNTEKQRESILNTNDVFIKKIITIVEKNLENELFSVEDLSSELFLSRTQVHRKIKAITGISSSKLMNIIRLEKAMIKLENKEGNVSEIAYKVGFANPSYFSKCFTEHFGESPNNFL
jgi:signal transduction histidine kinase/DNA-binding response OmpR family regulator